jgi:hypothetical protein
VLALLGSCSFIAPDLACSARAEATGWAPKISLQIWRDRIYAPYGLAVQPASQTRRLPWAMKNNA